MRNDSGSQNKDVDARELVEGQEISDSDALF